MKQVILIVMVALVALVGCEKPPPPEPPAPPPPPPPTADELYRGVMQKIEPSIVPSAAMGPILAAALQAELSGLNAQVNGPQAKQKVASDLVERLKQARSTEQWELVLVLCDGLDVMEPGGSRTSNYRDQALAEKARPTVKVKGFFEQDGVTNVFMDVFVPTTGKTESVKRREGEEFLGLVLEKIVGDKKAIQLRYKATGATFTVPAP
ncbi:MAG: hypothetical protein K1Y02_01550 [Candidatus Hydrogenedentes bacterium]|nr:hypothetical protein [Candidatus Hydrogenedentota bacterium]